MKKTLVWMLMLLAVLAGCAGAPAAETQDRAAAAEPTEGTDTAEETEPAEAADTADETEAADAALPYADNETGNADLDAQVLAVLEEVYDPAATEEENLSAVYHWVCDGITYRAGTVDVSGGFTDELTQQLALDGLNKRRGNCDTEAAVLAVLLQRLGYDCEILQGQFLREDGVWVDHAWVLAQVDGEALHLDPLYGRYYAADPADCFLQPDSAMEATHRWDTAAQ